jgi:hypothetical protein
MVLFGIQNTTLGSYSAAIPAAAPATAPATRCRPTWIQMVLLGIQNGTLGSYLAAIPAAAPATAPATPRRRGPALRRFAALPRPRRRRTRTHPPPPPAASRSRPGLRGPGQRAPRPTQRIAAALRTLAVDHHQLGSARPRMRPLAHHRLGGTNNIPHNLYACRLVGIESGASMMQTGK